MSSLKWLDFCDIKHEKCIDTLNRSQLEKWEVIAKDVNVGTRSSPNCKQ